MAGGVDDEIEIVQTEKERKEKVEEMKKLPVVCEDDPMDCSTLVAMTVVNSVVEEGSQAQATTPKKLPAVSSAPVLVDRATSPTLPTHMLPAVDVLNTNANTNNSNGGKSASASVLELKEDESDAAIKARHAQLMAHYHSILKDKMVRRTGSLGSVSSKHSLSSSLSLIPESHLPAMRCVTDKTSSEFPSNGNTSATGNEEPGVKRVSFQESTPFPLAGEMRLIGRPLPTRPLPPIGADSTLYNESGYAMTSPRSGNRPLPPLTGMGTSNSKAYDTLSLHSAGSSTQILHRSGSTNSLPNPDRRYSTSGGHMQKLGGARWKTPPPPPPPSANPLAYKPLPSIGISNVGFGERLSPRQVQ